MNFKQIIIAVSISISTFAAGYWLGSEPPPAPEPYRSKQSSASVVLDGDAAKVREALLISDKLVRTAELAGLLSKLGPESLDEVRTAFDTVFLDIGETDLILFSDWWARFDPRAAMQWSESEWRADHWIVAHQVLRAWARTDHVGALSRAAQGRGYNKERKDSYTQAALDGWEVGGDPGVLDYIRSLGPGIKRQKAMNGIARRRVLRNGIDEAFQWVQSLPYPERLFKLNLMRRVTSAAVNIDAAATAKWVSSLQGGPYFKSLPQRVVIPWAKKDPQATVAWLASLDDTPSRDNGVREAYRAWVPRDREGAIAWVTGTAHEPWRDPALAIHAQAMQLRDAAEGVALAEKIFDEELRHSTLTFITRTWSKYDAEAAKKYVDQTDWTDKERARALAQGWGRRAVIQTDLEKEEGKYAGQIFEKMERNLVESDLVEENEQVAEQEREQPEESSKQDR